MTRIPGLKRTISGRVVYDRKPHVFTGRDMLRVMAAINNADSKKLEADPATVNWAAWQAAFKMVTGWFNEYVKIYYTKHITRSGFDWEAFFKAFDTFFAIVVPIFSNVPGFGVIVDVLYQLYQLARRM